MLNIPQAVQDLFLSGTVHKNLRVHFPNGERADITNDQIVKESMKFNESLCSRDALKFGMSEASTIEFETVGVENILGMTIEVGIEVDTSSLTAAQIRAIQYGTYDGTLVLAADSDLGHGYYRVPLGVFVVTACPRSHGAMTHRRVIGYSAYYVMGDDLAPFNAWKLDQTYYDDGVNEFNVGDEFILSNIYADIPASLVSTYFSQMSLETSAYSVAQMQDLIVADVKTYHGVTFGGQEAGSLRALGCMHEGVMYTYEAGYSSCPLFQTLAMDAEQARQALRATVARCFSNEQVENAYYVDEYGRNVYLSYDEFVDSFTDDLLPPIRIVIPTGSGSYLHNLTYYVKANAADFSRIFSGSGTYTKTIVYVPTYYGIVDFAYPNWFYSIDGESAGFWYSLHAATGGTIYDLIPRFGSNLGEAYVAPTGEKKVSRRKMFSYSGGVNISALVDGMLETQGVFGKVSRLGGLIFFSLRNMPTGTPSQNDQSVSMPADVSLGNVDDLWWDEVDIDKIGVVVYVYRDSEADKEYTFTVQIGDADGSVYRMVNNEYIRLYGDNFSADQMDDLLAGSFKNRVEQMGDYTPCELTMQGMPWVEAGDFLRIDTGAADVPKVYTYMLQRTLSGIQHLEDEVVSVSGEVQINQ